jgi:hypothetical protein
MIGLGPDTVISILGTCLIGVAGLLYVLPVGTCSECGHCKLQKLTRQHERELQATRSLPTCHVCGRHHRPDEDHLA